MVSKEEITRKTKEKITNNQSDYTGLKSASSPRFASCAKHVERMPLKSELCSENACLQEAFRIARGSG